MNDIAYYESKNIYNIALLRDGSSSIVYNHNQVIAYGLYQWEILLRDLYKMKIGDSRKVQNTLMLKCINEYYIPKTNFYSFIGKRVKKNGYECLITPFNLIYLCNFIGAENAYRWLVDYDYEYTNGYLHTKTFMLKHQKNAFKYYKFGYILK